ncbi:hypothetical protein B0H14DRAFT_2385668 [Mycena olivaceomarginata]|nr:hypothetical protein B0H14DRAFT_2385668 [Mycena olivaceomarginata]
MNQNPWPEGNALFEDGRSSILGVRKVGPYRFPHAKLEEDGIIVKTHIPETGQVNGTRMELRPNTFLNITSLAPETFLVGLHHEGREKAVLEIDVKIVDLLEKQQNDKLLDLEYIQLNVSKLLGLLEKVFGVPGVPASATNEDTSLPRILVHENLLLFLRDACSTLEPR